MRFTPRDIDFLRPLRFLVAGALVTALVGCAASQPHSPSHAADTTPVATADTPEAPGAVTVADPGPAVPVAPDPVADLAQRVEQFVQAVQPGVAAAPQTMTDPPAASPAGGPGLARSQCRR